LVPLQSEFVAHATQLPRRQTGVGAPQLALVMHWAQVPPAVQIGVGEAQPDEQYVPPTAPQWVPSTG
jgi:hypothetical protein